MRIKPIKFAKNTAKSFLDVKSWFGTKLVSDTTSGLVRLSKPLFGRDKTNREEGFDQAMQRLNLQEEDLKAKTRSLLMHTAIYLVAAGLLTFYMLYLLFTLKLFLTLVVFGAMSLCLCKAYEAHSRVYMIKHRKLGVTFREWYRATIKKEKK